MNTSGLSWLPTAKAGATLYVKGDLAQYTGDMVVEHGGIFFGIKWLEGHKKGQTGVTNVAPNSSTR